MSTEYYCQFKDVHIGDKFSLKGYDFEKMSYKNAKVLIRDECEGNMIDVDYNAQVYLYELF